MRALLAILCSVLVCLGAYGAESGGFPSRPTFTSVVIKGNYTASTATGVYVGGQSGFADIGMSNGSAGADSKLWDVYIDASGTAHYRIINDALSSSADWLTLARTGITSITETHPVTATYVQGGTAGPRSVMLVESATGVETLLAAFGGAGLAGACLDNNLSGVTGGCNMPAGDVGLATTNAMFLHSGSSINTDATSSTTIGLMTTGTFALTYVSGCATGTATGTGTYVAIGKSVTVMLSAVTQCTTGGGTISYAGVPAALRPATTQAGVGFAVLGAGGQTAASATVNTSGNLSVSAAPAATITGLLLNGAYTYTLN